MPKMRYLALLLTAVAWPLWGAPVAEPQTAVRPFLWQVKTEHATAYLLGSLHVARKDIYPLPPVVYQAFDASSHLVVEANPFQTNEMALAQMMMVRALNVSGEGLQALLGEDTYSQLSRLVQRHGLTLAYLDRLKPWYVAQMLSLLEMKRIGIEPAYGIDRHFVERAGTGKPILELEGIARQLDFLDGFTREEQGLMLQYTLRDLENIEQYMDDMVRAWKGGDADRLEALLTGYIQDSPGLERVFRKLFNERDREMADTLKSMLRKGGSYFVVVGAGHLTGERGMVATLRRDGFTVHQLDEAVSEP